MKVFVLKKTFFLVILIFICLPLFSSQVIKVGIYENDPKVFMDKNGNPAGIFVDVLNEIAKNNDWKIEYIFGDWIDHITAIEENRLDVLVDAAFSQERLLKMKFNKIELLRSWLQLYTLSGERINTVSELSGKRIGLLKGSIQEGFFEDNFKDIDMKLVSFNSYSESVNALKVKNIDGIIVDRFFYFSKLRSKEIVPAPIIFKPEGLFYAFSENSGEKLISVFDKSISDLKNDPDSVFYRSLNSHLKVFTERESSKKLYILLVLITGALIVFVGLTFFLKKQVHKKSLQVLKGERRYKEIIELAADGILLGSKEGVITEANSCMEQILGKPRDQIIGLHITKIFPKETLERNPLDFESLKKGKVIINERELTKPDGTKILIEMHTKMMPDGTYQSIYRDITERKKIMEAVAKNQKLESIGILAGGIAHDFNNLLTGVYGYIDLAMLSCGDKDKCMKYTESAMKSLDRARGLTHQLLTFSKGGAPVIKSEKIESLVQEVARFALSGSKCKGEFVFDSDLLSVYIDKNQISQVIENIVINAQQSMPSGGVVKISVNNCDVHKKGHPVLSAGSYIKISIADTGTGIDQKHIDKIFDPFFTTKQKGSGLGLSASYSIVARHGGYIDVESVLGKGSVFHIYLPATEIAVAENIKSVEPDALHKGEGKVIVMDDEEVIRNVLSRILSKMNYVMIGCPDGQEAIDIYRKLKENGEKVKFMIFDLTVPGGMGGIETIEKIREIDKEVPVFVSSGYSEDPALSNPKEFGFSASIAKPFNLKELSKLLDEYFSQ
jgi:PAS domain S-box-containing protein